MRPATVNITPVQRGGERAEEAASELKRPFCRISALITKLGQRPEAR